MCSLPSGVSSVLVKGISTLAPFSLLVTVTETVLPRPMTPEARPLLVSTPALPLYVTSSFAACALMMILPLAVYLFGQKYMTKGLSAGALKD